MLQRIILFLVLNFGALAIGGFFTGTGVSSEWYAQLNKAPWTPPGWFFGFAWTTIMLCFSLYMTYLWPKAASKQNLVVLFSLQWLLNVSWNPVFFYFQNVSFGLVVISALTILVIFTLWKYKEQMKTLSLLLFPYGLWMMIATSLNAYILLKN